MEITCVSVDGYDDRKVQPGDGYKNIFKSLNVPWSPVKSIINKWEECGTAVNLVREEMTL